MKTCNVVVECRDLHQKWLKLSWDKQTKFISSYPEWFCNAGREIAPDTGANATKFFHFDHQILKISRQIGD